MSEKDHGERLAVVETQVKGILEYIKNDKAHKRSVNTKMWFILITGIIGLGFMLIQSAIL